VKKNFLFLLITYFFLIILFELGSRLIVYSASKDINIFFYGFKKNISFQIRDLSNLNFEIIDYEVKPINNLQKKNNFNKTNLWAFGGSSSDIACKKNNNTSWPSELENINNKYIVKNFARSGTNSDFALNSLLSNLYSNKKETPDIILWANYVNETDVLTFGFKNNKNLENKIKIDKVKNTFFYYLKSISISFENKSVFFGLFKRTLLALIAFSEIPFKYDLKIFTEEEYELAAKNYFLNTSKAIKISEKFDIKFYIVLLFDKSDLNIIEKSSENKLKDKIFFKEIDNLKFLYPNIEIMNFKIFQNNKNVNRESLFCDSIHFTSYGNKIVADLVLNNLEKIN
tara:strand:- start:68 stop:1093 length:1026 start_codon:yes stop_codon:yes gene_type:complete